MSREPFRALRRSFWTTSLCSCGQYQPLLQPPAVDDVADQIDRLGVVVAQEIEKQLGLAAAAAEMDVGDEERPEVSGRRPIKHRHHHAVLKLLRM